MGYCETCCQLCAISLAIARYRTAHEPPSAAWDYTGDGFVDHDLGNSTCEPHSETGCSVAKPREEGGEHEHLSGPGCRAERAYSGALISLAEMKGCRDVRAIVMKDSEATEGKEFEPEEDDEEWERTTRYFFTGTGNGSPDEAALDNFDKVRHGMEEVIINNINWDMEESFCLPVHPTCWQIFRKISEKAFGFVDVHGFWKFGMVEDDYYDFFGKFPRHPAVRSGNEQWWRHEVGSEWLAANPVEIPGFGGRIEYYVRQDKHFDVNGNVFDMGGYVVEKKEVKGNSAPDGYDPFSKLPAELRLMVQELLPSPALAALRQASRSMYAISCIVFRRLVFEDMPWLWEARDMPIAKTDWHNLYRQAKFVWPNIKGIKNRMRIWKEVSEICRRIQLYRDQGKIEGTTGWDVSMDVE